MDLISEGIKSFIRNGILDGIRTDGRLNLDPREYHLKMSQFKSSNGSCIIEVPDSSTKIICAIKLELDEPSKEKSKEGKIEIMIDCSHTKSSKNQAKNVLDRIQNVINSLMISSIPKETLCIVEGKKCWKLYLNIFILGYPSIAYIDAISLAIKAVFSDLKIPKLKADFNQINAEWEINLDENSEETAFPSNEIPILATIGKVGSEALIDMSKEELSAVDFAIVFAVGEKGNLAGFYLLELNGTMEINSLPNLILIAQKVIYFYHDILKKELYN